MPFSIEDAARCPLFPPALIELMERLIPDEKKPEIGTALVFKARLVSKELVRQPPRARVAPASVH